ncbi:MAG: DUF1573 domain-containing protein [Planctomycetaceae bacterium]|jgi:hypothetical protein|nr:DUF1573 domain-containing protein [Planctomycetaceae bacterium]
MPKIYVSAACGLLILFGLLRFAGAAEIPAAAETWGSKLFKTRNHDFGRVLLGADAEYRFEAVNTGSSEIRLLNVRSSCGCTSGKLISGVLLPGETGGVMARLNTSGQHLYQKSAVLTVQLQRNINGLVQNDTVQLFVSGFIRPDITLIPDRMEFGSLAKGESRNRMAQLDYSGKPNWAITKMTATQPFIYAKAEETKRQQGEISYKINVTLKENAPAGSFKEFLRFTTNEFPQGESEPVEFVLPVHGEVAAPVQAKPSPMLLGLISREESVTKNIIVRSGTAFRITEIETQDDRFRFAYSDQKSPVQMISVSFTAGNLPDVPLLISNAVRIFTDDAVQKIIPVHVFVKVTEK